MTAKTDPAPTDAATPARAPEPGPNTVTLSRPIGTGEGAIKDLTLREPSPGELRGIKLTQLLQLDVTTVMTVLPRITTPYLDEATCARLPMKDFTKLATTLVGFFVDVDEAEATAAPPSQTT